MDIIRCRNKKVYTSALFLHGSICLECSIKETQSEIYEEAVAAERGEICRGNWNYDGIGFEEEE